MISHSVNTICVANLKLLLNNFVNRNKKSLSFCEGHRNSMTGKKITSLEILSVTFLFTFDLFFLHSDILESNC